MKIAILLAAYNGQQFIREQLDSIKNQTYKNWCLYVIDDGSQDKTWDILQEYQASLGAEKMQIFKQKNQGSTKTFLTLVCDPTIQADYYAYSDQDDIWDSTKLERACAILEKSAAHKPQLYCSNVRLINQIGKNLGILPAKKRLIGFANALVQCCTTGNTMLFNQLAREMVQSVGAINMAGNHDWWTYLSISAGDSFLYYDPIPTMSYRLHEHNVVGFINNYFARYYKRLKRVLNQEFIAANNAHIEGLHKIKDKMSQSSKLTLDLFIKSRSGNVGKRLYYLYKAKVYRQELTGTLAIYVAQMLGKF